MASRSGPGQAKSMPLWRSFSNGMILRKMMSRNASLTAEPCPLTHTSPFTSAVHWQNAALIFACGLCRQSVEALVITNHDPWSYWNGQPCGPLHGLQHHSCLYILYMQRTVTPMTMTCGDCILLLFSSCLLPRLTDSWITFHNLSSHTKARAGKNPQWSPDIFHILMLMILII